MFENTKKTIYLNAGHFLNDPGAVVNEDRENKIVMKIRDLLVPLLKQDFEVEVVPDELNLDQSTNWVNEKVKNLDDGLALSIHLNASDGRGYGAETLYYGWFNKSKQLAQIILDEYCRITLYKNRGPKSDSTTRFGRLGWIRNTNCWSTLIECYFLDNESDRKKIKNEEIAYAIYCSVCKLYGVEPKGRNQQIENILKKLNKIKIDVVDKIISPINKIIDEVKKLKK